MHRLRAQAEEEICQREPDVRDTEAAKHCSMMVGLTGANSIAGLGEEGEGTASRRQFKQNLPLTFVG